MPLLRDSQKCPLFNILSRKRYRANAYAAITDWPGANDLRALPARKSVTGRVRARTITGQPRAHWGEAPCASHKRRTPLLTQGGPFAKGVRKKRGRKEDLRRERRRLTASATFLVYRLPVGFEHRLTDLKTKKGQIVNVYFSFLVMTRASSTALTPPASLPRIMAPSSSGANPAVKPR